MISQARTEHGMNIRDVISTSLKHGFAENSIRWVWPIGIKGRGHVVLGVVITTLFAQGCCRVPIK